MKASSPSIQEWKDLYEAAIQFRDTQPWNWMWDSNLFGVQDPESDQVGYCCVMGRLGEHFALGVYLGAKGLESYRKTRAAAARPDFETFMLQECLMASFEERGMLQTPDLQVIKTLGLKFRGRNAWPLFRSFQPGYHPWYLAAGEARFLTTALQQAIHVALRFRDDPALLTPPQKNQYLVRVLEREEAGWRWTDKWLAPAPVEKTEVTAAPIDEARLQRIVKKAYPRRGGWEIDFFYSPSGVQERGERPYYPHVILVVDRDSGLILGTDLLEPMTYVSKLPDTFLKTIERLRFLPNEVLVRQSDAFKLLEAIASRLGIRLALVKRLRALEEAQAAMYQFMG